MPVNSESGKGLAQHQRQLALAATYFENSRDFLSPDCQYRLRIRDEWFDVRDDAVITEPNRFGKMLVWPILAYDGSPCQVRSFMPGSLMQWVGQVPGKYLR
jgi:hypothetical protein